MAEYDLTNLVAPFLDRHLVFPLLEFLTSKSIYPENDLLQGKIELLSATNMVDFQIDMYKKLHNVEETPSDMEGRREKVVKELSTLQEKVKPFIEFLSNESLIHQLRQEKLYTPSHLKEKHSITGEQIETLYKFAKFQFDCGNYSGAMNCLTHYLPLSVGPNGERTRRYFSALWGKFAAEILLLNWESALKDMEELKQLIESGSFGTPVEQLQQRAWLIHWSLFIYFHYPEASVGLIDLCFYPHYLSTIQNICPHILRYLTAVVIINHTNNSGNKYRKNAVKELVKVLQQEQNSYRDPITEFLECLFVHFDFEGAQNKLRECEKVLLHDFFLVGCKDAFIENARFFIFETYCRIHQCIDIKMLAEKLNMENDQAEKWIVDLIRNARLDAKIDSAQGHIIMGSHNPTVYEQILEKTRDLYYKTQSISLTLTQDA